MCTTTTSGSFELPSNQKQYPHGTKLVNAGDDTCECHFFSCLLANALMKINLPKIHPIDTSTKLGLTKYRNLMDAIFSPANHKYALNIFFKKQFSVTYFTSFYDTLF